MDISAAMTVDLVLSDDWLQVRLSDGALVNAARSTWDAAGTAPFDVLAGEAARRLGRQR